MNLKNSRPCGDFRTSYYRDMSMFDDKKGFYLTCLGVLFLALSPLFLDSYLISLLIYIGFYAIAALGLNILVGFTGQISVGHAVFFGFGAFASAWLNNNFSVPVFFCIPLAAILTALIGLLFGIVNGISSGIAFMGIKVFPAVILGGLDSVLGAILGGLVIGLLEHLAHYIDVQFLNIGNLIRIAPFYALIIILMIKPYGFFGTKDIERV